MKDRSAPFSRKHRRYWLPVTGGMVLIGFINVLIGYCAWPGDQMDRVPERIIPKLPVSEFARPSDAGPSDAGPSDAGPSDAGPSDAGPRDAGPVDASGAPR